MRRKDDDFRYLLDLEIGYADGRVVLPVGIVQGQKLLMLLRRLTLSTWNVEDFDQLPIPFRAVAADIVTGDKVVFERGRPRAGDPLEHVGARRVRAGARSTTACWSTAAWSTTCRSTSCARWARSDSSWSTSARRCTTKRR